MWILRALILVLLLAFGLKGDVLDEVQPILQCPGCKPPILRPVSFASTYSYQSGDSCNFTWSDLLPYCREQSESLALVKCPRCNTVFWIEEALVIGDRLLNQELANKSIDCLLPTEMDYCDAATRDGLSHDKQIFARVCAWRLANNARRKAESYAADSLPTLAQHNLSSLVPLLDETAPFDRVLKAEALRELGRFRESLDLVRDLTEGELSRIAGHIRTLGRHNCSRLILIDLN